MDTLKKITFTNIDQFVEEINRNFAVVENSPLYKGIPGKSGIPGSPGNFGQRGSKFIFVNYQKFNEQFPGELINGSKINLLYLNLKLSNFEEKQKLFLALETFDLIEGDVIVLTNSIMLRYNQITDILVDTGLAFNEQSNLISSIEQKIENYVIQYINNHPALSGNNILEAFQTYAKNYTDTNNSNITYTQTETSVFVPYYPGASNTNGVLLSNHSYFGFADERIPKTNSASVVFGSIKKYIDLILATTETSQNDVLTSDYAPGANNIPMAVILQDTNNAGILIGKKTDANLKRFASIYKDVNNNLVFKSDAGILPSEFSTLLISRDRMRYNKLVQFDGALEVAGNFTLSGSFNTQFIRSGLFASDVIPHTLEIGGNKTNNGLSAHTNFISQFVKLNQYTNNVLITDGSGLVSKNYSLETAAMPTDGGNFDGGQATKIITSDYVNWLYQLIRTTSNSTTNFWRKVEFAPATAIIPALKLQQFIEANSILIGGANKVLESSGENIIVGSVGLTSLTQLRSKSIRFNEFASKILVTDASGNLSNIHKLCPDPNSSAGTAIPESTLATVETITGRSTSHDDILTGQQQGWLITTLMNIKNRFKNTYNKDESDNRFAIDNQLVSGNLNSNETNLYNKTGKLSVARFLNTTLNSPVVVTSNNLNAILTINSSDNNTLNGKQLSFVDDQDLYMRRMKNGGFDNWVKLWHSGNLRSDEANDGRYGQLSATNIWTAINTFNAAVIVPNATADTHAVNRITGDGRYGRLGAANTWSAINTFNAAVIVPNATADTHAVNRITGDGRYGRLAAANIWTGANTFNAAVIVPTPFNFTNQTLAVNAAFVGGQCVTLGPNPYPVDPQDVSQTITGEKKFSKVMSLISNNLNDHLKIIRNTLNFSVSPKLTAEGTVGGSDELNFSPGGLGGFGFAGRVAAHSYNVGTNQIINTSRQATFTQLTLSGKLIDGSPRKYVINASGILNNSTMFFLHYGRNVSLYFRGNIINPGTELLVPMIHYPYQDDTVNLAMSFPVYNTSGISVGTIRIRRIPGDTTTFRIAFPDVALNEYVTGIVNYVQEKDTVTS
jgi:hypothetical protein